MTEPAVRQSVTTAGNVTKWIRKWVAVGLAAFAVIFLYTGSTAFYAGAQTIMAQQIRTVSAVEPLLFGVTYIDDPTHYKGYTEFVSEGVMGEMYFEAQVLYKYGRADKVISMKTSQTGVPINRVMKRGTKVLTSQTVTGEMSTKSFIRPLKDGWLSGPIDDYPGHTGIDLAAAYGTPVYASAGGKVTLAQWNGDYGKCVIIQHADGSKTVYAHNSRLLVYAGQEVRQGQMISRVGSTGNSTGSHLHFEIRDSNHEILNPLIYIDQ